MASDDPVQLPTIQWTTPDDTQTEISSHLSSIKKHRHLRNLTAPVNKKRTDEIYQERIKTQQDTVGQDWFHSDGGGIYQHQWANHSSTLRTSSKDLLTSTGNSVRFNIRRAGNKASHTLRKLTLKQTPSISLDPSPTNDNHNEQDQQNGGRPLAPERTNSSFESTIPLPQSFDLARYRSTSSQSTLSTVDWIPLHQAPTNRLSRSSPQTIPVDLNDIEPEPRVPTPPPFPSSPHPHHSHSNTHSRNNSTTTSPLLTSPSPFLPLSPLTEHTTPPSRTLSSSPTSSLHNYSPPLAPPNAHRRTLTIDDYSAPSRRDTITSFLIPRNGNSLVSHLKNSLHLHQTSTHHSTNSSLGGSPSLSRSPTSINQTHTRRKHAKEELQKLFLRRKKLIRKVERGEEGEEKEKKFDRAIVERLKELGALIDEKEKVETDVLWEHQRGLIVFGLPKFSSAALFQFDPSVWTNEHLKPSPYTPHDFPCRPYWNWRDREFMVDMGGDKDEEGWSYAVFFHSKRWRGEPSLFRSFVRRRRWIRTRIYIPLPTLLQKSLSPSSLPSSETPFHSIDGAPYSDLEEEVKTTEEVKDLRSACYCLPLTLDEKQQLFESLSLSSSGSGHQGTEHQVPPLNPFIPFRAILAHSHEAQQQQQGGGKEGSSREGKELVWRSGVREINERRVRDVMKRVARIDRERLALWRVWLDSPIETRDGEEGERGRERKEEGWEGCSEWNEWRVGEMEGWTEWLEGHREEMKKEGSWEIREENEGEEGVEEEDFADKDKERRKRRSKEGDSKSAKSARVEKPDLEDVWDLIESRLDNILQLFDFHLTRLAFLRLLISCHPLASTPPPSSPSKKPPYKHQHEGYDLPFEERRRRKEVKWEKRLRWVTGVKEEVRRMEGGGPAVASRVEEVKKGGRGGGGRERTRSERRERKGKQRAIHQDF